MSRITEAQFLRDVANHQIHVLRDDGVYRHVRFRRPGTYCMGFDLITWPGHLCYTGDMGTYVFSRVEDMFEFFRSVDMATLQINPQYWSEKCCSVDRADGITKYSPDKFRAAVMDYIMAAEHLPDKIVLLEMVEDEVLSRADDGEQVAHQAASGFEHQGFRFSDFWECNLHEYTHRFIWCCYALVWGIERYDASRSGERSISDALDVVDKVPELKGSHPIVLYFDTKTDADEFVSLIREAKPGLVARDL